MRKIDDLKIYWSYKEHEGCEESNNTSGTIHNGEDR